MEAKQFIEMVVARRKSLGITQVMLAERVGTEQTRISEYERGAVTPGLEMALRMLDAVRLEAKFEPTAEESLDALD